MNNIPRSDEFVPWQANSAENLAEIMNAATRAPALEDETDLIQSHIDQRYWLLRKTIEHWRTSLTTQIEIGGKKYSASPPFCDELIFDLAVTDLFLERAQAKLTTRASSHERAGIRCSVGAGVILVCCAVVLAWVSHHAQAVMTWEQVVYRLFATSAVYGMILGTVYILVMIARASLHEGTVVKNRRHSLTLCRLFLYLKLTSSATAEELRNLKRDLSGNEMEHIFGWNLGTSSAYADIRGESATKTPLGQVLQTAEKGFEMFRSR